MTQHNLAVAYVKLPTEDLDKNLRTAIGCYEAACGSTPRKTSLRTGR